MLLSHLGEFGLINLLRKNAAKNKGVVRGIGDDAAVLSLNTKEYLLFTTDMLVEDVHFNQGVPPKFIGQKALACNISDIAAMGGTPTYAVVSLGAPSWLDLNFIKGVYEGINGMAQKFGVAIVGGDTVKSEKIVINIALLGQVAKKELVTRSGAKVGDVVFVTGNLGCSLLTGNHLTFTPRVAEARFLVQQFKPTAMIDVSDGLAADLGHILEESKKSALLYEESIPLAVGAGCENALYDGEDFELVFTLPPAAAKRLKKNRSKFRFYEIGRIIQKPQGLHLQNREGKIVPLTVKGFTHF